MTAQTPKLTPETFDLLTSFYFFTPIQTYYFCHYSIRNLPKSEAALRNEFEAFRTAGWATYRNDFSVHEYAITAKGLQALLSYCDDPAYIERFDSLYQELLETHIESCGAKILHQIFHVLVANHRGQRFDIRPLRTLFRRAPAAFYRIVQNKLSYRHLLSTHPCFQPLWDSIPVKIFIEDLLQKVDYSLHSIARIDFTPFDDYILAHRDQYESFLTVRETEIFGRAGKRTQFIDITPYVISIKRASSYTVRRNLDVKIPQVFDNIFDYRPAIFDAVAHNENEKAWKIALDGLRTLPKKALYYPSFFANFLMGLTLMRLRDNKEVQAYVNEFLSKIQIDKDWVAYPLYHFAIRTFRNDEIILPDCLPYTVEAETLKFYYHLIEYYTGNASREIIDFLQNFIVEVSHVLPAFWRDELTCLLSKNRADQAKAYKEKYSYPPLLQPVRQIPSWAQTLQKMLDHDIEQFFGQDHNDTRVYPMDRIGYQITPQDLSVVPVVMRCLGPGKPWRRTRLFPKKYWSSESSLITRFDRDILVHQTENPWGNRTLEGAVVLKYLVGHPFVTMEENPHTLIQLQKMPFCLSICEDKNGYIVSSNIDSATGCDGQTFLLRMSRTEYILVQANIAELHFMHVLRSMNPIPFEAKRFLRRICEKLATHMQIYSPSLLALTDRDSSQVDMRLTVQITPRKDVFVCRAYFAPSDASSQSYIPGRGPEVLYYKNQIISRDLEKEKSVYRRLVDLFASTGDFYPETSTAIYTLTGLFPLLRALRDQTNDIRLLWPEGYRIQVREQKLGVKSLTLKTKTMKHWLVVDGTYAINDTESMSLANLIDKIGRRIGNYIEIQDHRFVAIETALIQAIEQIERMGQRIQKDHIRLSSIHAGSLDELSNTGLTVSWDKKSKRFLDRIRSTQRKRYVVPATLQTTLRPYQMEGYTWLSRMVDWGMGAILADDMGLGKTVQAISLLLAQAHRGVSLVVMPTAVLANWREEIERFAPSLRIIDYGQSNREEVLNQLGANDVLLVTYGVLTNRIATLEKVSWHCAIFDEAHTAKNRQTKTSQALKKIQAQARILLTGTPIQNHWGELWNRMDIANPGLLGSYKDFERRYLEPMKEDPSNKAKESLQTMIRPFILRRTKEEVLTRLPEKTRRTLFIDFTERERAIYEKIRCQALTHIQEGSTSTMQALAALTRLRQVCCDARLIEPSLTITPAKEQSVLQLIEECLANGHRALIFSQFTSYLTRFKECLDQAGIPYLYFDGSYTAKERQKLVRAFQRGKVPLFVMSVKAGGIGLNLTEADYVIHLDPWWNPAMQNQASDRTYRMGQTRPVTIYHCIVKDSVEEKILHLHHTKQEMANAILAQGALAQKLTKKEILAILTSHETSDQN